MVNILGVSGFYHDSAAALVCDGKIVAAAQEERFSRIKHDSAFPKYAIYYCLKEGGIDFSQIDHVVFYEKPLSKFDRLIHTYLAYAPIGFSSFKRSIPRWANTRLRLPEIIHNAMGPEFCGNLDFVEHHESHAASAFYPSPFKDAAILTLDAVGEWSTSSIGVGEGNNLQLFKEINFPHSLGMLYSAFTYYTGFKVNSGEYKLMGLAPYGEPKYTKIILENIVDLTDEGAFFLNQDYFNYCQGHTMTSEKFHKLFGGPPRKSESELTKKEMDIAASIQAVTEEAVLRAANYLYKETNTDNLVMAGGVALNCVANGKLLRKKIFKNMWIQPAAGDAGGALGAALLVWYRTLKNSRMTTNFDSQNGSLLGPSYQNEDIGMFLDSVGAIYEYHPKENSLLDRVANLINDRQVIGWFQGRMEFGPRALGCRSIIGDPRSPEMQSKMNLKIKFRESFRPFAPCVLREHVHEVFEMSSDEESPYMLFVAPVRDEWRVSLSEDDRAKMQDKDLRVRVSVKRSRLPAITHVDYSARIQTVDEQRHGRLYRLMSKFYELTSCPVIVNTSFNIRGEPIVCSPEEAYTCFISTDMDCLVLENYLLVKQEQPQGSLRNPESYKAQYKLD